MSRAFLESYLGLELFHIIWELDTILEYLAVQIFLHVVVRKTKCGQELPVFVGRHLHRIANRKAPGLFLWVHVYSVFEDGDEEYVVLGGDVGVGDHSYFIVEQLLGIWKIEGKADVHFVFHLDVRVEFAEEDLDVSQVDVHGQRLTWANFFFEERDVHGEIGSVELDAAIWVACCVDSEKLV